ncbi:M48 family metallopeptidase [Spirulina sp. CS-785/01]|uniref:M48 family metallopeptidase n=1 Tax=Spirulina sp. CS-785/01 TaxID=3021716 RepID=UPI00232B3EBF|nr:M48 family metallopeptidase [Spirulina sp. CS-785/01]MDB9312901.1 M48 family metallopeptidase [Spirulina sp. CS-785/01]
MKLVSSCFLVSLGIVLSPAALAESRETESPSPAVFVAPMSPTDGSLDSLFTVQEEELAVSTTVNLSGFTSEPFTVAQESPEEEETSPEGSEDALDGETEEAEETGEDLLELTPDEEAMNEQLAEADRLWLAGEEEAAREQYRQAKPPFSLEEEELAVLDKAFYEAEELSPAGSVYWRNHQEGLAANLESKIFAPLDLLLEEQPAFIPGYVSYAEALRDRNRIEEAVEIVTLGTTRYPNEPELVDLAVEVQNEAEQWLEASLTARQFAVFNPDHPRSEEFLQLAEQNWERYQSHLRSKLTQNAIANVITGAAGFALTGNLGGPISAVQSSMLLMRGEDRVGEVYTNRILDQAPLLEDEEVLNYVREVGNKLTEVAGRDEFNYEFHVILEEDLNAFALPGGKIFVNAGAILETNSEAEFAGLLAHEISHAVLSHGFQLVTQGQLTASVVQFVPYVGGLATNVLVFSYSREMEQQADYFGTRILSASGYASDGMRNLMETLGEQDHPTPPQWLSTHPDTDNRVKYLEALILNNDYDRYGFEGVETHTRIRERVADILAEEKEE